MTIPTAVGRRFSVGKYEVVAMPMAQCEHMLRYTVFLGGKRLGALASVPTESDCRFLESPPYVPDLVSWNPPFRFGRKDPPRS